VLVFPFFLSSPDQRVYKAVLPWIVFLVFFRFLFHHVCFLLFLMHMTHSTGFFFDSSSLFLDCPVALLCCSPFPPWRGLSQLPGRGQRVLGFAFKPHLRRSCGPAVALFFRPFLLLIFWDILGNPILPLHLFRYCFFAVVSFLVRDLWFLLLFCFDFFFLELLSR